MEFHGDRRYGDDKAVIGGLASLYGFPVTVIGLERGTNIKDRVERNFGCAHPEGYRKALRLMKQAEKFHRPVITFIDTAGAYCGIDAEERGQGQAIAENLYEMATLKTPIIAVLIGEGEVAVRWLLQWRMKSGCLKTPCFLSFRLKAAPAFCGRTQSMQEKRHPV